MANVIFKKGLYASLPSSAEDNILFFCTDVGRLFQGKGIGNPLLEYSDIVTGFTDLAELEKANYTVENKLYVTDDGNIYIYSNGGYISLGGGNIDWNSIKGRPLKVVTNIKKIVEGIKVSYDDSTSDEIILESAKSSSIVLCDREW